jgi:hypothetical protein
LAGKIRGLAARTQLPLPAASQSASRRATGGESITSTGEPVIGRATIGSAVGIELDLMKTAILAIGIPDRPIAWQRPPLHIEDRHLVRHKRAG